MTRKQYERWLDFAVRMARGCYRHRTIPSGTWIEERMRTFIESCEDVYPSLKDWDHNTRWVRGDYAVGDLFTMSFDDVGHDFYTRAEEKLHDEADELFDRLCDERDIDDWKESDALRKAIHEERLSVLNSRAFERRSEEHQDRWERFFKDPVCCCVRAGLDMASAPSAGVVGFTVGDLRKMYPEGIPDWVAVFKDGKGKKIDIRTRPDSEGVWL